MRLAFFAAGAEQNGEVKGEEKGVMMNITH